MHPGFPSRTPTKGSVIAAEVNPKAQSAQDTCIPPHTVVFACPNQRGTIVQVQPKIHAGRKGRIAGVAIAGVQSPEDARLYPDSDGRFGIVNAGQTRLVARKYNVDGTTTNFEPMDQIWVKTNNNNTLNNVDNQDPTVGNPEDCGFEYANKTAYRQPVMMDYNDIPNGEKRNFEKLGTVVGCTDNSDLLTVELKIA